MRLTGAYGRDYIRSHASSHIFVRRDDDISHRDRGGPRPSSRRRRSRPLHQRNSRDRQPRAPDASRRYQERQPTRTSTPFPSTAFRRSIFQIVSKADDPIWRAAQNALYKISLDQIGPAYHTLSKDGRRADAHQGARPNVSRLGTRPVEHRHHDVEPDRHGPRAVADTVQVDRVRRSPPAAARYTSRGSAHSGHTAPVPARGEVVATLSCRPQSRERSRQPSTNMCGPL